MTATPTREIPPALESIFEQIERAYGSRLYYMAVAVTLTIPDICAGAELDLAKDNVKMTHYVAWCDAYLVPKYLNQLTGADFYHLRGGVIHTGIFGHRNQRFTQPIFITPETPALMHNVIMTNVGPDKKSALILDLENFVKSMREAVEEWYAARKNAPHVQANVGRIVREHPNGISPFIVGGTVVG